MQKVLVTLRCGPNAYSFRRAAWLNKPRLARWPAEATEYHGPSATTAALFLIDTFGFIFRAYHARARSSAPPMRTSTGISTEAVYIFNNMLRKLSKQLRPAVHGGDLRELAKPPTASEEFAEYKANRTEMPPDLVDQIPYVRRLLEAMRIPILEYPGFEADDVIGTLARARRAGRLRGGDRFERQRHAAARHRPRLPC